MPFNVLLLPLLGGYIFITNWNYTRFDAKRYSGERLIFHAAIAGVVFMITAFAVTRGVILWKPAIHGGWREVVPFEYTGTSFLAFLLGALAWLPLNWWFFPFDREVLRTIEEWNDFLEVMLERAMRETKQIEATLKSGKVYIGFVTSSFDPAFERKYIRVLPMASGYRDPQDQQMHITTDYARVYQSMLYEEGSTLVHGVEDFQVVVPVAEIQSVKLFDPAAYEVFNAGSQPEDERSIAP